jgi:nucleoside-diphosphate-sugar epimerase
MPSNTELLKDLVKFSAEHSKASSSAARDPRLRAITAELIRRQIAEHAVYPDPLAEPRTRLLLPESEAIERYIAGKRVLVTGAAGGVGSRLVFRLLDYKPAMIVLADKDRERLDRVFEEACGLNCTEDIRLVKAPVDLAEAEETDDLFVDFRPEIVFHLAAERNVVTNQLQPVNAIRDNIQATLNVCRAVVENDVERCVFASSRKATMYRPENVLGTTKRLAECVVRHIATQPQCRTRFGVVRFIAIVENSFVYHIFEDQIARNQALTVCDTTISHVFQNMNEAINLVLNAGVHASKGELFGARNIGWPIQIIDLALFMIHQSGKTLPIQITGLRAGDNGHEYGGVVDPRTFQDTMMFNVLEGQHHRVFNDYVAAAPFEVPGGFEEIIDEVLTMEYRDGEHATKVLDDVVLKIVQYNLAMTSPDQLSRMSKVLNGSTDQVLVKNVQSAVRESQREADDVIVATMEQVDSSLTETMAG